MKTTRRLILALLFCITILAGVTSAAYADSGSCGDSLSWNVDSSGVLTISGTGAMEDYASASTVPWGAEDIYAVVVEEGVTHVGSYAFSGLFLENVLLPESLESIGDNAFSGAAVTEAHFAGNLKQWRENVTLGSGNDALTNVIVCDKDVTYQGEGFSLANGVVTSTVSALPSDFKREYNDYVFELVFVDVTEIADFACGYYFEDSGILTNITSVTIPDSVTRIGREAFSGCTSLTSVTIPERVTSIGIYAFYGCSGLTSVTIGNSVTSIGDNAFYGCTDLMSVTIPISVTSIGERIFCNCSGLTSITIPDSVTSIGYGAFEYCSGLTSVTIPDSVTSIGGSAFEYCSNLTNVTIPDSVTSIGERIFCNCSGLTSVTIPDSVTSIGDAAFANCSDLKSVTISDSVSSIGTITFGGCINLTSVTIPDGVTSIGDGAFGNCHSLASVTIPDSVSSIGAETFYGCDSLRNVYYTGTAAMWNEITIGGSNDYLNKATKHCALAAGETGDCRWSLSESGTLQISGSGRTADCSEGTAPWYAYRGQITAIDIKDTVTYLGSYVFSGLENVPAISGMNGVTGIGGGAFKDCTALGALALPASVTSVGENAFSGCTLLTSAGPADSGAAIEFGWNRVIPTNAFNGADCLETLTIPEGVTRVMPAAAANCTALTAVSLPASLTNIQQDAFSGCASLQEIALPDALKTLGVSAFRNTGLTSVTIPISVTTIGNNSFDGSLLADVYYPGSRNQWNAITVGADNTALSGAVLHLGRFDINIDSGITNGSVSVSVNGEESVTALENDTVSLTVTPAAGYELESLTVMQGETVVTVTDNSFTMPAGDVTVTATFKKLTYTITWKNEDGSVIDTTTVEYGNVPTHEDASKPATAEFTYTFAGWTPELTAVTGEATYKATFTAIPVFSAPTFILPRNINTIEESAFEGLPMTIVEIPNGCESIKKWAFRNCTSLTQIRIPASVTFIDATAFDGCENVFVYGAARSTAETYAREHGFTFIAES